MAVLWERIVPKGEIERVISFLKTNGEKEMADIYACGIHDYANEKYQQNFDYPEEWFDETERVDKWISDYEKYIFKWMYDLIIAHKSDVLALGEPWYILYGKLNCTTFSNASDTVQYWCYAHRSTHRPAPCVIPYKRSDSNGTNPEIRS